MKIITYLFLTWGHKKGFCKPFHKNGHCGMLQVAWDLYNKPVQQGQPPLEKLIVSEERSKGC